MHRRIAVPLVLALLVCSLACSDSPTDPPSRVNLRVTVENAVTQARVDGVSATVQERGLTNILLREFTATTGADGAFRLEDMQPGWFHIMFSKPGFQSATVQITVDAGENSRSFVLFPNGVPIPPG